MALHCPNSVRKITIEQKFAKRKPAKVCGDLRKVPEFMSAIGFIAILRYAGGIAKFLLTQGVARFRFGCEKMKLARLCL